MIVNQSMNTSSENIKSPNNKSGNSNTSANSSLMNVNQENENLEEDMRKAKESADILRSVVLPLETEINTLKVRSDSCDKRIKELEELLNEV